MYLGVVCKKNPKNTQTKHANIMMTKLFFSAQPKHSLFLPNYGGIIDRP